MSSARLAKPHRVLGLAFFGMVSLHGARTTFAILLPFLASDLGLGLTAGTAIFWLNWVIYSLASIVLGVVIDRRGLRRWIFAFGGLLLSAGLGSMGLVGSGWQAAIAFGVVASLGSALVGNVPSNVAAVTTLPARPGTAVGIVNSGVGVGSALFPLLIGVALHQGGWRWAWVAAGVAVAVPIGALLASVPRFEPSTRTSLPDDGSGLRSIIRSRSYWGLFVAFALGLVAQHGALVHLPSVGLARGIPDTVVSFGLGAVGVASVVGRLLFGAAMDRTRDPAVVAIPASGLLVAGASTAAHMQTSVGYLASASLLGFGVAAYGPLWGNLVRARFPEKVLARAFGLLMLGAGLGGATGPIAVSIMVEAGWGYRRAFYAIAVAAALAVPLFFVRSDGSPRLLAAEVDGAETDDKVT